MDANQLQRIKQRYDIIGNAPALDLALETALKVAPVDLNVLVVGENGVGKEVFPRIIHDHSKRKNKKYFAINCGSIPEGTIDSELFGHEKGSFTGAISDREGYFGAANGGTLFLDEVGELPLSTQARLLRVLETGEYIKVGASNVCKTDVRIVAATNVNMQEAIEQGTFRQDLYYRLNTVPIQIPPLRERGEDILLLFRKFAFEMSEKYHFPMIRLTDAAASRLMAYAWPGNVRQLKNLADNLSITAENREIDEKQLLSLLPSINADHQLVHVGSTTRNATFENEREILYQILFDLRRDVSELKKIVNEQHQRTDNNHAPLTLYPARKNKINPLAAEHEVYAEDEADNNATKEKELIKQALIAHDGQYVPAAESLGMTLRVFNQKIKEYALE